MPVKYTTKFYVNEGGLNQDLGNILYNYSSNTVQISATGTTLAMASINYDRPTMILESDITATMDGAPMNGDQVLTFGPSIQPRIAIFGLGNNGVAFSNDGIIFNGLGTTNIPSNTGSAFYWDGIKWFGGYSTYNGFNLTNMISYDGIYYQATGTTTPLTNWYWRSYYNGKIYLLIGGGSTMGYSYDGINWTSISPFSFSNLFSLAWNGVVWLAGGNGTNTLGYSYDGITWTGLGATAFGVCCDLQWTGDKWIGVGITNSSIGIILYNTSVNGTGTWNSVSPTNIFSSNAARCCWNGKILCVGGTTGNALAYSYDGITYTSLGTSTFTGGAYGRILWNGIQFLACGTGNGNTLARSYNGINWIGMGNSVITNETYEGGFNARRLNTITYQRNLTIGLGSGGNTLAYSLNGSTWTGLGSTVFTTAGNYATYNGKIWVAAGQGGNTLAFSQDGYSWTGLGSTIFTTSANFVIWTGTLWVAAGTGGGNTLAYSYDGVTWIPSGSATFTTTATGLASNNTGVVAVGSGGNTMAFSTNGISWTGLGTTNITTAGNTVATNGTLWVAGGSGTNQIVYSYNGTIWNSTGFTGFSTSCLSISWNGTMWVATGLGSNSIAYSYNGINWTGTTGLSIFTTNGYGITWNGTMWIASGTGGNTLATSFNGITWTGLGSTVFTSVSNGLQSNYNIAPKPYIQHISLAFGGGGNTIAYSQDGITWKGLGNNIFSTNAVGGFWNGKMWIGLGNGGNSMAYSYDGINWTGLGTSMFSIPQQVCYNGTLWVGIGFNGANGIIAYSYDGFNWKVGYSEVYSTGYNASVAWNGTYFLATLSATSTSTPGLYNSTNGINWTKITPNGLFFNKPARCIVTNGSMWQVAIYGGGSVYTFDRSGVNGWTNTSISTVNVRTIIYNGYMWVTGTDTILYYSRDGINYTSTGTFNSTIYNCWNGKRFLIANLSTTDIIYSSDGITWYTQNCQVTNGSIASNSGVGAFVAPSAMIMNKNGIANSQTLEIVSSDPYYQTGFTNMAVKVESNNIYV